jgi:hypothetical protein
LIAQTETVEREDTLPSNFIYMMPNVVNEYTHMINRFQHRQSPELVVGQALVVPGVDFGASVVGCTGWRKGIRVSGPVEPQLNEPVGPS